MEVFCFLFEKHGHGLTWLKAEFSRHRAHKAAVKS